MEGVRESGPAEVVPDSEDEAVVDELGEGCLWLCGCAGGGILLCGALSLEDDARAFPGRVLVLLLAASTSLVLGGSLEIRVPQSKGEIAESGCFDVCGSAGGGILLCDALLVDDDACGLPGRDTIRLLSKSRAPGGRPLALDGLSSP